MDKLHTWALFISCVVHTRTILSTVAEALGSKLSDAPNSIRSKARLEVRALHVRRALKRSREIS
jgi:hypothetical protein